MFFVEQKIPIPKHQKLLESVENSQSYIQLFLFTFLTGLRIKGKVQILYSWRYEGIDAPNRYLRYCWVDNDDN